VRDYGNRNAAWIGATPPTVTPEPGQFWWRNDPDGNLFVSYNDGTSTQWVPAVPTPGKFIGGSAVATPVAQLNFGATAETTVATFSAITTKGGNVLLLGSWGLYTTSAATGLQTCTVRVKRSGTLVFSVILTYGVNYSQTIPVPACMDLAPPAGTYTYTVTIQQTGNGIIYSRLAGENGQLFLQEILG
jgi:hypothetical protein